MNTAIIILTILVLVCTRTGQNFIAGIGGLVCLLVYSTWPILLVATWAMLTTYS